MTSGAGPSSTIDACSRSSALEGFQSGLSWLTILRKRENFRRAFAGFDPATVAEFGAADVDRLLGDAGIVRHRGKIEATINNAQRCVDLVAEFGSLAAYIWTFEPPDRDDAADPLPLPSQTPASLRLSKDLKRRGWRFVGPTTVYAFMQAMGLVNDHVLGCEWRATCAAERLALTPPRPPSDAPLGPFSGVLHPYTAVEHQEKRWVGVRGRGAGRRRCTRDSPTMSPPSRPAKRPARVPASASWAAASWRG